MTEVVIEAGHFDAFTAAAIAAGLQVSTTFNARLPCLRVLIKEIKEIKDLIGLIY
jgi:hypothetical protein